MILIAKIDGADALRYIFLGGFIRQASLDTGEGTIRLYTYKKTGFSTGLVTIGHPENPNFEMPIEFQSDDNGVLSVTRLSDGEHFPTLYFRVEPPPGILDLAGYWVYIDYPYVWSNALQRWLFIHPDWEGLWMADMDTGLWYLQPN